MVAHQDSRPRYAFHSTQGFSHADSKKTARNPHRIPTIWRPESDSCKMTRAAITTTIGYSAVNGTTTEALPPLFKAAKRPQEPSALSAPPSSAQQKLRV